MSGAQASEPPVGERVGVVVIHGVGETGTGWINEYLIPPLTRQMPELDPVPHSEVHRLPDTGSSRPDASFQAFIRRATIDGRRSVAFIELFWADLSRVGTGPISGVLAILQLFYEAPQVLCESFLKAASSGLSRIIKFLVLFANWLLRWPITGLNIATGVCAIVWLVSIKLERVEQLAGIQYYDRTYLVGGTLLLLAAAAWAFARWRAEKDIALTDIGLSTAVFSIILLAVVVFGVLSGIGEMKASPAFYLRAAAWMIFSVFHVWNVVVVLAIALLLVACVGRLFGRGDGAAPLSRLAAALALSTVQGTIWKVAISVLWVLLIGALVPGSVPDAGGLGRCLPPDTVASCAFLSDVNENLTAISLFNTVFVLVLAVAFIGVAAIRAAARRVVPERLLRQKLELPRIIVSPLVILILLAGTVFNYANFYIPQYTEYLWPNPQDSWKTWISQQGALPLDLYDQTRRFLRDINALSFFVGGTSALTLYAYLFGALRNASRGVLHIVRDIVDHQYTPRFTFSSLLLPRDIRKYGDYPRRNRINARLDVLMREVVDKEQFDRLVFVAHSQGTLIVYDYLRSNRDEEAIKHARRIDIVTLGSPLTHLYQHYFSDYDRTLDSPNDLNPKVGTWINLWRIDDPIGARVDKIDRSFIENIPLTSGGHVDYWKEDEVCLVIMERLNDARGQSLLRTTLAVAGEPAAT